MCSSNSFWGENSWWWIIILIILIWVCCGRAAAAVVPAVPVVIIPAAAAVIAATAAAERPTYPQKGEAPRERCLFRFLGIGQLRKCEPRRRCRKRSRP